MIHHSLKGVIIILLIDNHCDGVCYKMNGMGQPCGQARTHSAQVGSIVLWDYLIYLVDGYTSDMCNGAIWLEVVKNVTGPGNNWISIEWMFIVVGTQSSLFRLGLISEQESGFQTLYLESCCWVIDRKHRVMGMIYFLMSFGKTLLERILFRGHLVRTGDALHFDNRRKVGHFKTVIMRLDGKEGCGWKVNEEIHENSMELYLDASGHQNARMEAQD